MPPKIEKRGSNSYRLFVSGGYENGKQQNFYRTIQCANIAEAKKEYSRFSAECLNGKVLTSNTPKMTLQQFFNYWMEKHIKPNRTPKTIEYNIYISARILAALGHLRIDKIKPQHILELLEQLRRPDITKNNKPLSENTIRKHYTLVNTILNVATKWNFIPFNPMAKLEPPKKTRIQKELPTTGEISEFLNLIVKLTNSHKNNPNRRFSYRRSLRLQTWVFLAFSLGLRREEIFGLQMQDIDFERNHLHIRRAAINVQKQGVIIKDTKTTSSNRTLAMPDKIIELLKEYIDLEKPTNWLFFRSNGEVMLPDDFNSYLKRLKKRYNTAHITPHVLRHMYGSYLLRSGIDLASASHQLGHSNKSFTADTYIHVIEQIETRSATAMQNILNDMIEE